MRKAAEFAGLVVLMVGARYVPLDRIGAFASSKAPAPPVVTGSVSKTPEARAGSAKTAKRIEDKVQTILAQATEGHRSNSRPNGQSSGGDRSRIKTDDFTSGLDGLYTGGTGLADDAIEDDTPSARALAAANPDDFLVICEAGCRPSNDRIVYRVSKIAAAASAIAERRLEVTAAQPKQAEEGESTGIVCVAGCYDDEPRKKHAQQSEKTAAKLAQLDGHDFAKKAVAHDDEAKPVAIEPEIPVRAQVHANVPPGEPIASGVAVSASTNVRAAEPADAVARPEPPQQTASAVHGDDLVSTHLISAETQAHLAAKRSKLAAASPSTPAQAPVRVARWRTKVTSIVALQPSTAPRSVVALAPFDTSVSVESGWDSSLVNTQ